MNKLFKGAVAGAAGVALLLGGAGTFALWNDSFPAISGQQIQAGQLRFDPATVDGTWSVTRGDDVTSGPTTLDGFNVVPGDVIRFHVDGLGIIATGNHLTATLSYTDGPVVVAADAGNAADVALAAAINGATPTLVVTGTVGGEAIDSNTFEIAGGDTANLDVTLTLTFPAGVSFDNATQQGRVTLSDIQLTLEQGPVVNS